MPREFVYRRRVQFAETDAAGIVHFAMFYRYMEEAEHAMWRDAGLSIEPRGSHLGWPRIAASFEFKRPLRFEEEFDVHIRVEEIGARTIRYACQITRHGKAIAAGAMTIACIQRRPGLPMRAIDIPEEIATALSVEP